jgi:hypothetical protein
VTFSLLNKVQCIIKHKYGETIDWSKRYVAIGSGTKAGVGSSVNNPCEFLRKKGDVLEVNCPTMTNTMRQSEYFAAIHQSVKDKECFLKDWAYTHKYLPRYDGTCSTIDLLKWAIKRSPIMVSVESAYHFDTRGRVRWGGTPIAHEVLIVKFEGDTAYILDSENNEGLVPFDINYRFHYPKLGFITKLKPLELNTNSMAIESCSLIRKSTGDIDLLNSSGFRLHFPDMPTFKAIMGDEIVEKEEWNQIPDNEFDAIPCKGDLTLPLDPSVAIALKMLKDALLKKIGFKK